MVADIEQAKPIVEEIQKIIGQLDHVITLYLNSKVYMNGDFQIVLSETQKDGLKNEYDQIKDELKDKIDELP